MQWWFKKFCKGDESLEDNECSGWPSEVDTNQLSAIIEASYNSYNWKVAKEFSVSYSSVIRHLKQIGKVKKLDKWVPCELTGNQKVVILKCHLLLFYATMTSHFSIGLLRVMESGFFYNKLSCRRSSKALPKAKLAPKKVMVTVWGSAASLINYRFLNPSEIITSEKYAQQINEMHWKLQCLQLALVNRKYPVLHNSAGPSVTQSIASKAEWIKLWGFVSSAIFTWPLANWLPLLQAS